MPRSTSGRFTASLFTIAMAAAHVRPACAQSAAPTPTSPAQSATVSPYSWNGGWHVTMTIFRSPGTGIQVGRGPLALFVAHYPTAIVRDANRKMTTTHFVRAGVAAYLRPTDATSPYVSLSIAPSLSKDWTLSGMVDVGVRRRFSKTWSGQVGVAALRAPKIDATRLNPTVGLGISF